MVDENDLAGRVVFTGMLRGVERIEGAGRCRPVRAAQLSGKLGIAVVESAGGAVVRW
jgi:hypothetical protein